MSPPRPRPQPGTHLVDVEPEHTGDVVHLGAIIEGVAGPFPAMPAELVEQHPRSREHHQRVHPLLVGRPGRRGAQPERATAGRGQHAHEIVQPGMGQNPVILERREDGHGVVRAQRAASAMQHRVEDRDDVGVAGLDDVAQHVRLVVGDRQAGERLTQRRLSVGSAGAWRHVSVSRPCNRSAAGSGRS